LTVHQETCPHLHRTVERIRELGVRPGVCVNPSTPVETLAEIAPYVDLVLIMSVNPGFGGQRYIRTSTDKLRRARALLDRAGRAGRARSSRGTAASTRTRWSRRCRPERPVSWRGARCSAIPRAWARASARCATRWEPRSGPPRRPEPERRIPPAAADPGVGA